MSGGYRATTRPGAALAAASAAAPERGLSPRAPGGGREGRTGASPFDSTALFLVGGPRGHWSTNLLGPGTIEPCGAQSSHSWRLDHACEPTDDSALSHMSRAARLRQTATRRHHLAATLVSRPRTGNLNRTQVVNLRPSCRSNRLRATPDARSRGRRLRAACAWQVVQACPQESGAGSVREGRRTIWRDRPGRSARSCS